ncbi:MAG: ComEA family DNA-binding protein [Sedimentisphaerales bacterium]
MNYSNGENREHIKILTAIFFIGFVLNICFVFPLLGHSSKMGFSQIDNKLNPNTASVYELAELPSIGEKKAQAIVEYRQNTKNAFRNADDLEYVKGIGEKTAEKIKQWFVFE